MSFPEVQGPQQLCNAILMTEDDGDVVCQQLLPITYYGHRHRHTTAEGRVYQW